MKFRNLAADNTSPFSLFCSAVSSLHECTVSVLFYLCISLVGCHLCPSLVSAPLLTAVTPQFYCWRVSAESAQS